MHEMITAALIVLILSDLVLWYQFRERLRAPRIRMRQRPNPDPTVIGDPYRTSARRPRRHRLPTPMVGARGQFRTRVEVTNAPTWSETRIREYARPNKDGGSGR